MPWLHIRLGITNHAIGKLIAAIPEAERWPKGLHLHLERYHGQGYEGRETLTLLNNVDRLEEVLKQSGREVEGARFVKVFETFREVNKEFCKDAVNVSDLQTSIENFKVAWKTCGLPNIPKSHMVFAHAYDFALLKGEKNLSQYSEQQHESIHYEFQKTWMKYKVKEMSNPRYKSQLLQSVRDFNGCHGW